MYILLMKDLENQIEDVDLWDRRYKKIKNIFVHLVSLLNRILILIDKIYKHQIKKT